MVELKGLSPAKIKENLDTLEGRQDTLRKGMIVVSEGGEYVVLREDENARPYYVSLEDYLYKKPSVANVHSAFLRNLYQPEQDFSLSDMVGIRTKKIGKRWEVFLFKNDRCKIIFGGGDERRLIGGTWGTPLEWSAMFAMVNDIEEYIIRGSYE